MSIITPNKFAILIENMVRNKKMTHLEAVLSYCKENNVEPSGMSKMINKSLKERLEVNAMDLRLLKERTGKLPL
tara:strand:- start:2157 stop:2378 length:222 start_codon:yes stop_codon:yes gene_type:complete